MPYVDIERRRECAKRHYAAHLSKYKARAVASNRLTRKARHVEVAAIKASRGCVDCGVGDPVVLDFDHRPGVEKCFNVSDAVRKGLGRDRILLEIEKCDVRCANCHRRMEHLRRQKCKKTH